MRDQEPFGSRSRPGSTPSPLRRAKGLTETRHVRRSPQVYAEAGSSTDLTALLTDSGAGGFWSPDDTQVFHGEFDPGSGRTLAACLTHASGATNQASAWGRAANG